MISCCRTLISAIGTRGMPVSIVKAGMRAIGRPAGRVRTPLTDLDASELDALSKLIAGRS